MKHTHKKAGWMAIGLLTAAVALTGCSSAPQQAQDTAATPEPASVPTEEKKDYRGMFEPLGEIPVPADNPMSDEKVELGKMLYVDSRLSGDNKSSCMTCHATGAGYGDNRPTFVGFEGFQGSRNSPTVINAGYYTSNFWDGSAASLEEQALGPIQSEKEMHQNIDELVTELKAVPEYVDRFKKVFNGEITPENIGKAIAAFERTIVIKDSAFDKYLAGDDNALTEQQKLGMDLFVGKGSCLSCHGGALLSDNDFHNIGVNNGDEGRFAVTKKEEDKFKFRTSALRGIGYTAPYMHDGSLKTIKDVIEFYNRGGNGGTNVDPRIKPLDLSGEEVDALVAFMESLNGTIPQFEAPKIP